jgi:hypothetical protein
MNRNKENTIRIKLFKKKTKVKQDEVQVNEEEEYIVEKVIGKRIRQNNVSI